MVDEHDDDLEPEVNEGDEIETQNYVDLAEDFDDDRDRSDEGDGSDRADGDEEPVSEDDAGDTI